MTVNWMAKPKVWRGALLVLLLLPIGLSARKFYDDDPIEKEPPPLSVSEIKKTSSYEDFLEGTFSSPGEEHRNGQSIRAQGVNTLGEVPDSVWYTNRHYRTPMSIEQLVRGPGMDAAPSTEGSWKIVAGKGAGTSLGFTIQDAQQRTYLLKFDPLSNPEMASAADVLTAKFFYALGYNVPENYIVYFHRQQLTLDPDAKIKVQGKERKMTDRDLEEILRKVPYDPQKGYRAVASRFLSGQIVGPFVYHGTRRDDPNDTVPHEHRRDLRGLYVFAAWLGHYDAKADNTLDVLVEENGGRYIKHHLIDFGATLGSSSHSAKDPQAGNEYVFDLKPALLHLFTLGFYLPPWVRAHYPNFPSVGTFDWKTFKPEEWKTNYPNPAFQNRLPDDTFWAAKQVMAFSDEEIRAIVKTGQYSDPKAEKWVADCLIARRDKIGQTFFSKVLPLDQFRVEGNRLLFADLRMEYGFSPFRQYEVTWHWFDNDKEQKSQPLPDATGLTVPRQFVESSAGTYYAADIRAGNSRPTVTVYLRKEPERIAVVGVEHAW